MPALAYPTVAVSASSEVFSQNLEDSEATEKTITIIASVPLFSENRPEHKVLGGCHHSSEAYVFKEKVDMPFSTCNLKDQKTLFVRLLSADLSGMRNSVGVNVKPPCIAQWVTDARKPLHHDKLQSVCSSRTAETLSGQPFYKPRDLLNFICHRKSVDHSL
ncbi:hypothetical protein CSKR_100436 [Clonorchis sinensis]|uniref:Uncharacterized protein n=1 Tax=Clonorchis sinensis TaxID=79923 RepID=A0A3R7DK29_CLOSI|nr:hypothetical protein CSKR_100436 [Clonorchis sinensis]